MNPPTQLDTTALARYQDLIMQTWRSSGRTQADCRAVIEAFLTVTTNYLVMATALDCVAYSPCCGGVGHPRAAHATPGPECQPPVPPRTSR